MTTSSLQDEPNWAELSRTLGVPEKELKDPPRAMFKHLARYKVRIVSAENKVATAGLFKGAHTVNMKLIALDANNEPVRRAVSFLTLPFPGDTAEHKFTPENRERAIRNLISLVQATGKPEFLAYKSKTTIGTKTVYLGFDDAVIEKIGPAYSRAKANCLAEIGRRFQGDTEAWVGTEVYAEVYISESKTDGRKYTNWQNFRITPPENLILDPKQMMAFPEDKDGPPISTTFASDLF